MIEAFDQPWKRALEGTVGGHWGLFDDATRRQKFAWGKPVSNHPFWPWQAAAGVVVAALIFAAGWWSRNRIGPPRSALAAWWAIAANATGAGVLAGWTAENVPIESLGFGGWLRGLSFAALSIAVPVVSAAAMARQVAPPPFAKVVGRKIDRATDPLALLLGILLLGLTVLTVQSALSLAFDPRYRDFPFAPLTAAALPFLLLSFLVPPATGRRVLAETVAGAVLALCGLFIVWNETLANWQALWFAAAVLAVTLSLIRARGAPG